MNDDTDSTECFVLPKTLFHSHTRAHAHAPSFLPFSFPNLRQAEYSPRGVPPASLWSPRSSASSFPAPPRGSTGWSRQPIARFRAPAAGEFV